MSANSAFKRTGYGRRLTECYGKKAMSDVIIEGLFVLAAAIASGVIAIVATRSGAEVSKLKEDKARLEKQVARLLRQVESYHLLEDLYASDLAAKSDGRASKTIKTEYRNRVVELHQCERPEMTANEANKRLQVVT